jgi:hypothetical protein
MNPQSSSGRPAFGLICVCDCLVLYTDPRSAWLEIWRHSACQFGALVSLPQSESTIFAQTLTQHLAGRSLDSFHVSLKHLEMWLCQIWKLCHNHEDLSFLVLFSDSCNSTCKCSAVRSKLNQPLSSGHSHTTYVWTENTEILYMPIRIK